MAHYMMQFRYSAAAVKAMVGTPQDRSAAAKAAIEAAGGRLLQFYFTLIDQSTRSSPLIEKHNLVEIGDSSPRGGLDRRHQPVPAV